MSHLSIDTPCADWMRCLESAPAATFLGRDAAAWRDETRRELGLPTGGPIIGTGHQSMLWHPGILAKYLLTEAVAGAHDVAQVNLVVDQHASTPNGHGDFGGYDAPIRRPDGLLAVRRIELTRPRPDVPMALHDAFVPASPPAGLPVALPGVQAGIDRIDAAVRDHRDQPNAALQMADALDTLMRPWVRPMLRVTASDLLRTTLGRTILAEMAADPGRCAAAYNEAVTTRHEGGMATMLVRDDYVELPLWRLRDDGRRMHAYDGDIEASLATALTSPPLMPRALLLTALMRLGMCDLFVHGLGGGRYDGAMERWIERWLGVTVAPAVVASATLRLPLADDDGPVDLPAAVAAARRVWHDPEPPARADGRTRPGPVKRELLAALAEADRGSRRRREAFFAMHRQLETLRSSHAGHVERSQRLAADARRRRLDAAIADRRDWPFPLYDPAAIDGLAGEVVEAARGRVRA